MTLVDRFKFPVLNISQFYPRPGTPAAKMRRVPNGVSKGRSRRLTNYFSSLDPLAALLVCVRAYVCAYVCVCVCVCMKSDSI